MSTPPRIPPRFVPTLTEVVPGTGMALPRPPAAPAPAFQPPAAVPAPAAPARQVVDQALEELLVHRIIQRVDVILEERLREAIATVIQEQTRSIVPRLREEVESVVRQAVCEAVAEELPVERRHP